MNLAQHVLKEAVAWCSAIAMVVVVIFLIPDIIKIFRGEISIGKILVKVFAVLVLLGIMFATMDFSTFGKIFSNLFKDVVTENNLPDIAP